MSLFGRKISFSQIDPLGNGLREEIAEERLESDAITLEDGVDEGQLSEYWKSVETDLRKDKEWTLSED